MRPVGIKNQLLLLALLPGALIALVLFAYFTYGQLQLANDSLRTRGITLAEQLGPASEYGFIAGNAEVLDQIIVALLSQNDVKGVAITDTRQRVIYATGDLASFNDLPVPQGRAAECADRAHELLFCAPLVKTVIPVSDFAMPSSEEQTVIGAVYVVISTATLQEQRNGIIVKGTLITGFLLLLTGYLAARVGNGISTPLVKLTRVVTAVGEGDLDQRVRSSMQGEIGRLERGVDTMIVSLRQARNEMQANIDDATSQLRQALGELEERNRDLVEQRTRAQEASEAKSRFLANMSHEIRTPLSGMVGLLFLMRHTRPTAEQQEYLDNLQSSATTLRSLIDDVLDLSRIEAGRLLIHEQRTALRSLANSVAAILAPAAHQKDVELLVHIEHDVPCWINTDPLRLRQVLTNLLGNAVKFTENGFVRLYVSIAREAVDGVKMLHFVIEDSGIGIAAEKLDYIFESFAQADESTTRRYGGSGLGTTISRELVNLMGGALRVTSREGKGTTFSFELPLRGSEEMLASSAAPPLLYKVLLLENDERAAAAEVAALSASGFEATRVANGDELLAELKRQQNHYQLIVLAENSRSCRWQRLAEQLRDEVAIPLAALTFYDSGCDHSLFSLILHKPLDGESLSRRWEELQTGMYQAADAERGKAAGARTLAVLLAEDDPINARVMSFFLQKRGHEVVLTNNGVAALESLRTRHFDIAFLDMRMPEMDGLMVARAWRGEEGRERRLPIIAVTANVTREDRQACFEAGMDDFASKPLDPDRLDELLRRYGDAATSTLAGG